MAARKTKGTKDIPWPEQMRKRIQAGNIHRRLLDCLEGKIELSTQQVTIGLGLLKKVAPDLSATELSGEVETKHRVVSGSPMTDTDWEKRYADDLEPKPK